MYVFSFLILSNYSSMEEFVFPSYDDGYREVRTNQSFVISPLSFTIMK